MTNSTETERAELIAERAELIAKNEAATSWGAAVGARSERIKEIDRRLAALHPFAQDQKQVAWTEALRPFATCVFNDNGDITIDTSHLRTADYVAANDALKATYLSPPPAAGWDEFKPTTAQINSACLSYRHDFGLLDSETKDGLRFQAGEWLYAWQKEFAYALRTTPAATKSADDGGVRWGDSGPIPGHHFGDEFDAEPQSPVLPDHGGADAGVIDACWRTELDEIVSHLGAAITQSVASDDQIIMDHVKAAHEIAKVVRRQA